MTYERTRSDGGFPSPPTPPLNQPLTVAQLVVVPAVDRYQFLTIFITFLSTVNGFQLHARLRRLRRVRRQVTQRALLQCARSARTIAVVYFIHIRVLEIHTTEQILSFFVRSV